MKIAFAFIFLVLCCQSAQLFAQSTPKMDTVMYLAHDTVVQIHVQQDAKFQNGDLLKF